MMGEGEGGRWTCILGTPKVPIPSHSTQRERAFTHLTLFDMTLTGKGVGVPVRRKEEGVRWTGERGSAFEFIPSSSQNYKKPLDPWFRSNHPSPPLPYPILLSVPKSPYVDATTLSIQSLPSPLLLLPYPLHLDALHRLPRFTGHPPCVPSDLMCTIRVNSATNTSS